MVFAVVLALKPAATNISLQQLAGEPVYQFQENNKTRLIAVLGGR